MPEETNKNEAGDVIPSRNSPETTDMASANAPDPAAVSGDNPNASKPPAAKKAAAAGDKPAAGEKPAAAKKEKAPAVEDKPFMEFMEQDYVPALKSAIATLGVRDLELSFSKQEIPIRGMKLGECWQVAGTWQNGYRQFNLYFPEENIQGKKAFSCNEGKKPSTLESFLIDERKVTLDMLVSRLLYRLNGQKWLGRN
jgi:hypothetical protein